jgi:hypothetical protein
MKIGVTNLRTTNLYELKKYLGIILACFAGLFAYGQMDTSRYAIIPYNNSTQIFLDELKQNNPYPLSLSELASLDTIIKRCIRENSEEYSKMTILVIGNHLFFKQVIASINPNNEIIIWVNSFCRIEKDFNWKKEIFIIHDGGGDGCYFHVEVNLTTKSYSKLYMNGF